MGPDKLKFVLTGKEYTLNSGEVEDAVKHVEPRQIGKYYIEIQGLRYPPKQVISEALGIPPADFISTDATRILKKLGFKIDRVNQPVGITKTESEQLFESYLNMRGLTDFSFETALVETNRRPDYSLGFRDTKVLFEVKQFIASEEDFRSGFYDPYRPIREKIGQACRQFKGLKDYCCCPVLYNREKPRVRLSWQFIYGALLGNLAVRTPFDQARGLLADQSESGFFGGGGKGVRYAKGDPSRPVEPQNRTISAIVVLEQMPVGERRLRIALTRMEEEMGRKLSLEEHMEIVARSQGTERDGSLVQPRVVVCENPHRLIPFPRGMFCGPYDELYGPDETSKRSIIRLYAGEQIKQLEAQEESVKSPMQRIIEESTKRRKAESEK